MKYCRKCGVLYSSLLPECPKCNAVVAAHERAETEPAPEASGKTKLLQWLGIVIGVPALIFLLYFVISNLYKLS